MKAVRLIEPGRPLEMRDIPVPEIGAHEALVRVMAAGICHSDAHYRSGVSKVHPLPVTPGHESRGHRRGNGAGSPSSAEGRPGLYSLYGHLRGLLLLSFWQ